MTREEKTQAAYALAQAMPAGEVTLRLMLRRYGTFVTSMYELGKLAEELVNAKVVPSSQHADDGDIILITDYVP